MPQRQIVQFHNDPQRRPPNAHPDSPREPEPYVADPELIEAVNLAIYLRRPLLLEGEAGCGKTRLAKAVAYELGLPYYRWDIRSDTKVKDGLYEYDAILRLHDVEVQRQGMATETRDPSQPGDYRTLGRLGKAFCVGDRPAVLLIDEIDKADVDFPNDLLAVLDEPWEFEIRETGEVGERRIRAAHEPIVFVTSNREKGSLPAPFLRRCLYYYLQLPTQAEEFMARMEQIVAAHRALAEASAALPERSLLTVAIQRFWRLRTEGNLFKVPGTSEFLDWLKALQAFQDEPYSAAALREADPLPYPELLFKLRRDWENYAIAPSP